MKIMFASYFPILFLSLSTTFVYAEDKKYKVEDFGKNAQLECKPQLVSAISFNKRNQTWQAGALEVDNAPKFLLKRNGDTNVWSHEMVGSEFKTDNCNSQEWPLDEPFLIIKCNVFAGEFFYSSKTSRFVQSSINGYVDGDDRPLPAPFIAAGTCKLLD